MSCVEKRHMSHRTGSMLHHRFPNGFTDLFMDETDREVSTLTDRAFRSLCVGDDAVYNDDFLYGYSPFSCHKPLAGEPLKKNNQKESKKSVHNKHDKSEAQKDISDMTSLLKALSVAEESCEGMLMKNGGVTDTNGESWDKSALRSIQRELSEFSTDYHTDKYYKEDSQHRSGDELSNKSSKNVGLPSGKSTKVKNGKSTVKLRKLNIKNFFLHSELSPFQTWKNFNRYPFGHEDTVAAILSADDAPKWYDMPFYKELTEAHRKQTQHTEEEQKCHKDEVEPSDPVAPKPLPPPPPPKVRPKPSVSSTEKRCASDGGDGTVAPWRRNKSRAKSAIPASQILKTPQENNPALESLLFGKKEVKSVEVKAVEEANSLASTPFSICQLMTPLIPSRQPTETSEILQTVFSPLDFDFPGRPNSEAKVTPELPVKRESYKSLASSILFNLKDNRKRVKSRYSPHKFKTLELPEGGGQSPQSENAKAAGSEGNESGLNTPAILKDGAMICSPISETIRLSNDDPTKNNGEKPPSDDYLLTNLLQGVGRSGNEEETSSQFKNFKTNKSPSTQKQNYPSLNLYKKSNTSESDLKYLQVPAGGTTPSQRMLSPKAVPTKSGVSPGTQTVLKDNTVTVSPHTSQRDEHPSERKRPPNVPEKPKCLVKDIKSKEFGMIVSPREKEPSGQTMSTKDVIRAAREAINAAKSKARSTSQNMSDAEGTRQNERDENVLKQEQESSKNVSQFREETKADKLFGVMNKEPPPVPKRNFTKSDIQLNLEKQQVQNPDRDLLTKAKESVQKQDKMKHLFSSRLNNYIKNQRHSTTNDKQGEESEEGNENVQMRNEANENSLLGEMRDSENTTNDLQALKELERAKMSYHAQENTDVKPDAKVDEETKAKNDLISRELRNLKKGMLSMRGNTLAKREMFLKKEQEQSTQDAFSKLDSNVIVNKALINDNYNKAKMALEEIITEREMKRNKFPEKDGNLMLEETISDDNSEKPSIISEGIEKQNDNTYLFKDVDLKERLEDLRDHKHLRRILSQTEPHIGESFKLNSNTTIADSPLNTRLTNKTKQTRDETTDTIRQDSKESGEHVKIKKVETPRVPPRNKKVNNKRDGDSDKVKIDNETDSIKGRKLNTYEEPLSETRKTSETQKTKNEVPLSQIDRHVRDNEDTTDAALIHPAIISNIIQPKTNSCLSPKFKINKSPSTNFQKNTSPKQEVSAVTQESCKLEPNSTLIPEHLILEEEKTIRSPKAEEFDVIREKDVNVEPEALSETPRSIVSPLLLVNGSVPQSPPDQASLSSKSSYFSVESALHRITESESNIFQSLENLSGDEEEIGEARQIISPKDSDRAEMEYYSLSDHESEAEGLKHPMKSPQKEQELWSKYNTDLNNIIVEKRTNTAMSPASTLSPTLDIPALFKVKDNTFIDKLKKVSPPWSPKGSSNSSEKMEEEEDKKLENPEKFPVEESLTIHGSLAASEIFKPQEISPIHSPLLPLSIQKGIPNKIQSEGLLTVPHESEDRFSRVTPLSEGVESLATSTTDTAEDTALSSETKVLSERSGSTCSGNDSQTGLPKPPAVLPKSEKAVQKAIKLTNRRMKKEEAQKLSHKSSESSKNKADRHKSDKSQQKSSSGSKSSRSGEKKTRGKPESGHKYDENNVHPEQVVNYDENRTLNRPERSPKTQRQTRYSEETNTQNADAQQRVASERQGRRSDRQVRDNPEKRHYSSDRIISGIPVYKTHANDKPTPDKTIQRSVSIDRYLSGKVERRLSTDVTMNEILDPRAQRIEKSIMDELQQRGRAKEKTNRDNLLRRSHSIDAEIPHPSSLSRQSSHTSQLSRQSSIEPTVVTQSFPMAQRKLLQDPDSGQLFFVDLPVQVKTKTFFDPSTGSFVQLPVQPTEDAVPQASPMEVLTPPLVVYHGFVPIPLSPMAKKTTIHKAHIDPEEFQQRHLERARQMHCKEGHPYLEPAYGQHDLILSEFMGTEELDVAS